MKSLYLLIDFFTILVPFLFSFHPKLKFYKEWKPFFAANLIVLSIFIPWDIAFTQMGVWGFNPTYLCGIYIYNLPIEEILFFICIPYSCVFTYHCLKIFFKFNTNKSLFENISIFLIGLHVTIGLLNYDLWYTSVTYLSTAFVMYIVYYHKKYTWADSFLLIYMVLLIPFFIVNGILTGTGLESPVVWYNNSENLAIRIGTIPIEDVSYGFEMVLINVIFYEKFKLNLVRNK